MNQSNLHIEQYIIQYFEGNLSPAEKDWLLCTIEQNSYYRKLFELYKQTFLSNQSISFTRKDLLKKDPQQYIINEWEDRCIRYIENELTPEEQNVFLLELQFDKDKRNVFEQYLHTRLSAQTNTCFTSKSKLKKDTSLFNTFEELCIQSVENIISESDEKLLKQFIENDIDNRTVFELYSHTVLKPDITLVYPYKRQLKKTPTHTTLWLYWTSVVAASVLILFLWFTQSHETKYSLLARNNMLIQMNSKTPLIINNKQLFYHKTTTQHIIKKTNDAMLEDVIKPEQHVEQITILDTISDKFVAEKPIASNVYDTLPYDDKTIKEILDKLFASDRYHYFHDLLYQTAYSNQHYNSENQVFSFWKLLQKGSKYLNYAGANVKLNKYDQPDRVKKEIAIGSLYFSTTSQK